MARWGQAQGEESPLWLGGVKHRVKRVLCGWWGQAQGEESPLWLGGVKHRVKRVLCG